MWRATTNVRQSVSGNMSPASQKVPQFSTLNFKLRAALKCINLMRFHHHPNKENRKSEIYYTEVVKIAFFPIFQHFHMSSCSNVGTFPV